jgi:hypothetical protein
MYCIISFYTFTVLHLKVSILLSLTLSPQHHHKIKSIPDMSMNICRKMWNKAGIFRDDEIQCNFLGWTTAWGCKGFPTFRELTPSPSLGCAGDLVAPKLITVKNGDVVSSRNVGKPSHPDMAVCPRKFHWNVKQAVWLLQQVLIMLQY